MILHLHIKSNSPIIPGTFKANFQVQINPYLTRKIKVYLATRIQFSMITVVISDTATLRNRSGSTSTGARGEKRKMVRRSSTMTSIIRPVRRSSLSIARNFGSGLSSLRETLTSSMQDISSSMQDISEAHSSSTFYISENEAGKENESDDNFVNVDNKEPSIKLPLSSNDMNVESVHFSALFESSRYIEVGLLHKTAVCKGGKKDWDI